MMLRLVLLLAVFVTVASEDTFKSLLEVFEAFQDRKSTHCDVAKYEAVTGSQSSCDTEPTDGLVSTGTFCVFTTSYFSKTTAYCDQGFWYTESDGRPHYHGYRQKRFDMKELFRKWNDQAQSDEEKMPTFLPDITSTTFGPLPGGGNNTESDWRDCPMEPYFVTPRPGEKAVSITFTEPSYGDENWNVEALSNNWLPSSKQIENAMQYAGQIMSLSYIAKNSVTGFSAFCTIYFQFEVKQCNYTELSQQALYNDAILECDSGHMGLKGEKCHMTCGLGSYLSMAAFAECEEWEDGSLWWNWKSEEDEETSTASPFCEHMMCNTNNMPAVTEDESDMLSCYDIMSDSYVARGPGEDVKGGMDCKRQCAEPAGQTCSQTAAQDYYESYNWFHCDVNGNWTLDWQDCGYATAWKKCQEVPPYIMNGDMCCQDDWCEVICDRGYYSSDYAFFTCMELGSERYGWVDANGEEILSENFPGTTCNASCGALPEDIVTAIGGEDNCFGMEAGDFCMLECPEYYAIEGTSMMMCELNYNTSTPEWVMSGIDMPSCQLTPCDDLKAPQNGQSYCTHEEDGSVVCDIQCEEGFTYHLTYNSSFTCHPEGTGRWPDADDIPVCVEASTPQIQHNLHAQVAVEESGSPQRRRRDTAAVLDDNCGLISNGFDPSQIDVTAYCPKDCSCTMEEFTQELISDGICSVTQYVTLDCMTLSSITARATSMFSLPLWKVPGLRTETNPSISNFMEVCQEGFNIHQPTPEDVPMCVKCVQGAVYNKSLSSCEMCESEKTFMGRCVPVEDVEPEPEFEFCDRFDHSLGLRFDNCSDPYTSVGTTCKVHCESPDKKLIPKYVFANCKGDGTWEYRPETPICEGIPCSPGYYSWNGMEPCFPCERGTYAELAGQKECTYCPTELTTAYEAEISNSSCNPPDSIMCWSGDYYDYNLGRCTTCPMGTYCPDGLMMEYCPDMTFSTRNGSSSASDCMAVVWTVEGDDTDQRIMDIHGLFNITEYESMQFWIKKPHDQIIVSFVIEPYILKIQGDGYYELIDGSISETLAAGFDMFFPENTVGDGWLNISHEAHGFGFILKYGQEVKMFSPASGVITPIQSGLETMTIMIKLADNADITSVDEGLPFFALMQVYINDNSDNEDDYFYYYSDNGENGIRAKREQAASGPSGYPDYGGDYGGFDPNMYPNGEHTSPGSYGPGHTGEYPNYSGYGTYPPDYTGEYPNYSGYGTGPYGEHTSPGPYGPGHTGEYPNYSGYGTYPPDYTGEYPNYPGHTGEYPNYSGYGTYPPDYTGEYPNYPGHTGEYPNYSGYGTYPPDYTGEYPNYPGHTGEYPNYSGYGTYPPDYTGKYPNYPGHTGEYPNYSGYGTYPPDYTGEYPNYPGHTGEYPNYSGYGTYPPDYSGEYPNYPGHTGEYPNYSGYGTYPPDYTGEYPNYPGHTGEYPNYSGYGTYPPDYTGEYPNYPGHTGEYPNYSGYGTYPPDYTGEYPNYPGHTGEYPNYSGYGTYPPDYTGEYPNYPGHTGEYPNYSGYGTGPYGEHTSPGPYGPGHTGEYPNYSGYGTGPYGEHTSPGPYGPGNNGSYNGDIQKKRDCYRNLLNINLQEDWPQEKPVSCSPGLCPDGRMKPDKWTCQSCRFAEYYSYDQETCVPCPDMTVTRQQETDMVEESVCVHDAWYVTDYERGGEYEGPSAYVLGLTIDEFSSLSFYIHEPMSLDNLQVNISLAQYQLVIYGESFQLYLRETILINGLESIFSTSTGSGWVKCVVSLDLLHMQMVVNYGEKEERSPHLLMDLGLSSEEITLPPGPLHFTVDVLRIDPESVSLEGSAVYFAYPQLYQDPMTVDCERNEFSVQAEGVFLEGCDGCISTPKPYTCPEMVERSLCKDPMYIFEDGFLVYDCPQQLTDNATCSLTCTSDYFLHGTQMITCLNGVWNFDWHVGQPECKTSPATTGPCREPTLPDFVEKMSIDEQTFNISCEPGYEFPMGYDEMTEYTCNLDSLQWEPSVEKIPSCYEPQGVKTGFDYTMVYENFWQINEKQIYDYLIRQLNSDEVQKNSPYGWEASLEIVNLQGISSEDGARQARAVIPEPVPERYKVEARIVGNPLPNELDIFLEAKAMPAQFKANLESSGLDVIDEAFGTTEVICGDQDIAAQGLCAKPCRENEAKNAQGNCEECNKQTSIVDRNGTCILCPPGSKATDGKNGTRTCAEQCPPGSYSKDGYKNVVTGKCTKCKKGDYQDRPGQTECIGCPGLTTSPEPGSSSCTSDYALELTNQDGEPFRIQGLVDRDIDAMSLAFMVKRKQSTLNVKVNMDGYEMITDDDRIIVRTPDGEEAEFLFDANDVSFDDYTAILITIDPNKVKVYLDGRELGDGVMPGMFTVHAGAELEVSGNGELFNWYMSDRTEKNPMDFTTREGVAVDSNLFRKENVDDVDSDMSLAKTHPSTFQGIQDYCENNPCQNQATCSRGIGKANCTCPVGFAGKHCETEYVAKAPEWSDWTFEGPCSVTCGGGTQQKKRTCSGEGCEGSANETVICNTEECRVCPPLAYSADKVIATQTTDGSEIKYELSCPAGKLFAKINGTITPATEYTCSPDTGYNWVPKNVTAQCTSSNISKLKGIKKSHGFKVADPAVMAQVDCGESSLADFKSKFLEEISSFFACLLDTSAYKCELYVIVEKCTTSAQRKKRAAAQDLTLEFTLPVDEATAAQLQNFYDTNTVSPGLLDVVQAIANIESTGTEINSLSVTINGNTYAVDPSTISSSSSATCSEGYYADGTSCVPCGTGTYYDAASNFCVYCSKGTYQNTEAQISCLSCDTGYTTSVVGSTNSSDCIVDATYVGPGGDDGNEPSGTVIGIAVGVSVGALVLIGIAAAVAFKFYIASKAKRTASFPDANIVMPRVPEKKQLYNEIMNPHFIPPKTAEPPFGDVLESRSVTPPGTVTPIDD